MARNLRGFGLRLGVVMTLAVSTLEPSPGNQRVRATVAGVVRTGSGVPVAGAQVTIPALSKSALSTDSGEYQFSDVPAGKYTIRARKIGFVEFEDSVVVPTEGNLTRHIALRSVRTLEAVEVIADAGLSGFEDNRRIGLGKFLTRADLEPMEQRKMAEILQFIGAGSLRNGSRAWVGSSRGIRSFGQPGSGGFGNCTQLEGSTVRDRDLSDPKKNPGCGCFAPIWLDDFLLYSGDERGLVPDINRISPATIEAIEYYKSAAQAPLKYSRLNSQCGVLVLHSRRANPRKPVPQSGKPD